MSFIGQISKTRKKDPGACVLIFQTYTRYATTAAVDRLILLRCCESLRNVGCPGQRGT